MDGHNAHSIKSGLKVSLVQPHKISTQKKSHLPLLISCSASCRP
ncbi:hypothetical protein T11_6909 [Trichinella zimbabwensis]|uniref:Uncharacterized protein n=1 Tax=Trichinella zimbabwensis TaxID=268475 RepID=A0A0V1GG30_9BILA|nr:hypothetical protein T11_6909 [Trichinella zimbabwensis]